MSAAGAAMKGDPSRPQGDGGGGDAGLMLLPNPSVSPDAEEYPISFRPGVMSDTQLNTLRGQISEYSKICQTLVQLHHQRQAQLQAESGIGGQRDGNTSGGKTARQRWTPTPSQLQVLENIFAKGNGTPSKQRIKDITKDLSVHGPIQDTNVYNWFQNRKARAKRKQQMSQQTQPPAGGQGEPQPYSGGAQYGAQPQQVEAAKSQWVPIQVTINDRPWEVMGGMLDVKSTFGEGVLLFDVHNNVVPLSLDGVVLSPVQAGCIYKAYNPSGGGGGMDGGAAKRKREDGGFDAAGDSRLPPQ